MNSIVIGVLRCVLRVADSNSLKSKRQVVGGIVRRVRNEFPVAIAEVGELDRWQVADIAVACVSGDGQHADRVLASVLRYLEGSEAEVTQVSTELLRI